jgi:hypothetical protein
MNLLLGVFRINANRARRGSHSRFTMRTLVAERRAARHPQDPPYLTDTAVARGDENPMRGSITR